MPRPSALARVVLWFSVAFASASGSAQPGGQTTEELRIGAVASSGPNAFHRVRGITVGPQGEIYVANGSPAGIRAFTSGGEFVRTFGRQGNGPGEFRQIDNIWMTGDSVVVMDWQAGGRVSVFNARGELVSEWSSTLPDGTRTLLVSNSPAGWLARVTPVARPAPGVQDSIHIHLLDHRTRAVGPRVHTHAALARIFPGGNGRDWPLFEPRPPNAPYLSGYIIVPKLLDYEYDFLDYTGKLLRTVRHSYTPRRLTQADVQEYRSLLEQHYARRGSSQGAETLRDMLARVEAQAALPMVPHMSPIGMSLVGSDGELWVERPDLMKEPAVVEYEKTYPAVNRQLTFTPVQGKWDRFDARGVFQGQVTLPANFTPMAVHKGAVYGVSRGADDVEFVVRLRVTPPRCNSAQLARGYMSRISSR